ncbi:MAG: methylmalonyl Co-A mutase-associated GTPase MeaB [Planctomycetes bacterium]|nr:methylmalonyl Co-A mutase-associated GTPase MeaB [Planctomycetota bacterium]
MSDPEDLAALRSGDPRAIGRTLTLVENDPTAAEPLLEALAGAGADAPRIGITGPPGAGKSTLVASLLRLDLEASGAPGVVAVDPSSEQTGGAVLGDRVRLRGDEDAGRAFFRSVATRGSRGGLARTCADLLRILAAAGKRPLYLETVGVGQSELEIAELVDTVVLVLVPESGDFIQTLKAGVLEVADIVVVNKADREGAQALAEEIADTLHRSARLDPDWDVPVLLASARTGDGVTALRDALGRHASHLRSGGGLARRRAAQVGKELRRRLRGRLEDWLDRDPSIHQSVEAEAREVAAGRRTPTGAARRLWDALKAAAWR